MKAFQNKCTIINRSFSNTDLSAFAAFGRRLLFTIAAFSLLPAPNTPCYGSAVQTGFVAFSVSRLPPQQKIAASSKQSVHEGMTLKHLVETLGPGWMSSMEGIGICRWFFDDGSVLYVLATDFNPDDVLAFDRTKLSYMWWSTK